MYDKFEDDDSSWSFALGLLVGAVVGAAVASLFTPRSGAQNREAVIERGLVLRDRVTEATDSVTTRVRDTATTVRDRASEGAERVGAAAGATLVSVQEAANTAAATVKDAAESAAERAQTLASTATEKVQEAANTAAATVKDAASTATERAHEVAEVVNERAQDVATRVQGAAGVAAERARQLTGRESTDEFEIPGAAEGMDELEAALLEPDGSQQLAALDVDAILNNSTETLAGEARYDAEDVRSAAVDSVADEQVDLEALAAIDTFDGATGSSTALDERELDIAMSSDDAALEASILSDEFAADSTDTLDDLAAESSAAADEFESESSAMLGDDVAVQSTTAVDDEFVDPSTDTVDVAVESDTPEQELTTDTLPPMAAEPMDLEAGTDAASDAQAELRSDEQFVVDEQAAPLVEDSESGEDETQRPA